MITNTLDHLDQKLASWKHDFLAVPKSFIEDLEKEIEVEVLRQHFYNDPPLILK